MLVRKAVVNNHNDAVSLIKNTGCAPKVIELFVKKAAVIAIIIEDIDNRAANILKQDAIASGADASVSENVSRFKKGFSNALLFATKKQAEKLIERLSLQPFGLKETASEIEKIIINKKVFKYKNSSLDLTNTAVMGIINLDPASFSGDGLTDASDAADKAAKFEEYGAKIIDIGAESSRPGAALIDAKIEIKRLIPALKKIRKTVKLPISIDTYKYETAEIALKEGADIVNDIFALRRGKDKLAKLIASQKAGVILMHMKGVPQNMQKNPQYKNCISEIYEFLKERKNYAQSFGIEKDFISVDPGPGFGKNTFHNLELIKNMSVFSTLGAVVGAVSRKRFVRETSGDTISEYVSANVLTAVCGADIIRVHDVKETINALNLAFGAGVNRRF
ncbi:MAG: dihydropteroate synthase [Endomicrobium sp.]|jgi:dihydropteroate synthase|nr:dihydropteroate synthase [Endomicrobium sp.]